MLIVVCTVVVAAAIGAVHTNRRQCNVALRRRAWPVRQFRAGRDPDRLTGIRLIVRRLAQAALFV